MKLTTCLFLILAAVPSAAFQLGPLSTTSRRAPHRQLLSQRQAIAVPLDGPIIAVEEEDVSQTPKDIVSIADRDVWVENLDYDAFRKDVNALGKELLADMGDADVQHLNKILTWRNIAAIVGISTMWVTPNPITIAALSTWTYASWTMVAHHVSHGGYNRVDAGKYNSRGFAIGSLVRRLQDWTDWMLPEAWNVEHNRLHHYHLGENKDPDLVQRNLENIRDMTAPVLVKYTVVAVLAGMWKWFYYAPNTYKELKLNEYVRSGKDLPKNVKPMDAVTMRSMLAPKDEAMRAMNKLINVNEFLTKVLGPMFVSRFVLLPAPLLLVPGVGPSLFGNALVNLILADVMTNLHGFLTIVTNHAGDDVYAFDNAVKPRSGAFYVRQVVGSVNYATGTDAVDFSHGWLNYQIEHHVWPDLSMLQYQKGAPKLKAICAKHSVPYVQESVWKRLHRTVNVMVGKTSMPDFPTHLEPAKDKAGISGVTWKSTNGAIDEEDPA